MNILSIQTDHNSSACLFIDGNLVYFNQEERLAKLKNEGSVPFKCLEEIKKITKKIDNLIITGYNCDEDKMFTYLKVLSYLGFEVDNCDFYKRSHHLAHASRAFFASKFSNAIVIVWDGRGSSYNLTDGSVAYETTSVFKMSYDDIINDSFKLLYKKLYRIGTNSTSNTKNLKIAPSEILPYYSSNVGTEILSNSYYDLGHYYTNITKYFGFNCEEPGKLMGLHSYGSQNKILSNLISNGIEFKNDLFDQENVTIVDETNLINLKNKNDLAYETQKNLEKIGLNFIQKILSEFDCQNLILTGGVSLNIVANSFYRKNLDQKINLYIDPLCGDEGNSIGIGQFDCIQKYNLLPSLEDEIYLCGNFPCYEFELENDEIVFENIEYSFIVDLLLQQNIVAIFQGKSEAGPRALGNRSILFDPRNKNGKDIVNKVKKRESFRPFACSILLEESHKWFDMTYIKESPYMMYSFDALPGVKNIIPSVVHVDNTSRIQTVTRQQNKHYYNLILEFYKLTNVPILFNTSFNLAGDTIVETVEDALNTLRKSQLEYLYLPEIKKLIYIKNE